MVSSSVGKPDTHVPVTLLMEIQLSHTTLYMTLRSRDDFFSPIRHAADASLCLSSDRNHWHGTTECLRGSLPTSDEVTVPPKFNCMGTGVDDASTTWR